MKHDAMTRHRPHERDALSALRACLGVAARAMLDRQLDESTKLIRSPDGRLVEFGCSARGGSECLEEILPLSSRLPEFAAARAMLRPTRGASTDPVGVDLVCRPRRCTTLEFDRSPESLRAGAVVIKATALIDPMREGLGATEQMALDDARGPAAEFLRRNDASDLHQPLSEADRRALIGSLSARLPRDYLDLVATSEGATLGAWRVLGLRDVWRMTQEERTYFVLAESDDAGWVGVAQGYDSGELFWGIGERHDEGTKRVGTKILLFLVSRPDPERWDEAPRGVRSPSAPLHEILAIGAAMALVIGAVLSVMLWWKMPTDVRNLVRWGPLRLHSLIGAGLGTLFMTLWTVASILPARDEAKDSARSTK